MWANSPWAHAYRAVSELAFGPEALHLRLTLAQWAADGLLAIFFFVVGLELKREFVAGDLRDPARAALPIAAAIGGMIVPAAIFVGINLIAGHPENLDGWAVPIATDIAFALAVLAVLSTHLPTALRTFLLTLAVVDDLLAITIIAVFYTDHLAPGPLALALIPGGLFAVAVQRGVHRWWVLVPLAVATWALVHASGVHATVAGVLLGLRRSGAGSAFRRRAVRAPAAAAVGRGGGAGVRVLRRRGDGRRLGRSRGSAAASRHRRRVRRPGASASRSVCSSPTFLLAKFTHATLDDDLAWRDVLGVALLAGIGFTVSLLIGELAFGYGTDDGRRREDRGARRAPWSPACWPRWCWSAATPPTAASTIVETADADDDGVPDIYRP